MKWIFLFLSITTFALADFMQDLEENGYCIIPEVLSSKETEILYQRVWHEYIEKAWPNCQLNDRSNWEKTFPIHNPWGIFCGPAGQTQVMWDLRQDPRILAIFAKIWNTNDLIVSMDGFSIMCPSEIRESHFEPTPHVDQTILRRLDGVSHNNLPPNDFISESSLKTHPYTIQGQFLFEDSFEGDGGFYCIPKSHLLFDQFAPKLESLEGEELIQFKNEYFANLPKQQITAPRGSLILWDSRTVHWNQHPDKNRSSPKVRMVGFLCYVPKSRLTEEGKLLRIEAFEKGVSTGHNPSRPELKYTRDHIFPEFKEFLEHPSYIQPKITLSPLGQSLLGW